MVGKRVAVSKWFIVQTKPNQEKLAADVLIRAGTIIYFPQVQVKKTHGRRTIEVARAFLSRYIFMEDGGSLGLAGLRRYPSINSVVRVGSTPVLIEGTVLDGIRKREVGGFVKLEPLKRVPCLFKSGERVKITVGAYNGIEGVFKHRSGERRAMLFLGFFGRQAKVEVDLDSLVSGEKA